MKTNMYYTYMVKLFISESQKEKTSSNGRNISYCDTRRVVNSVQCIPTQKPSGKAEYTSKQSYIDQKIRKSCDTIYEPSNREYAMNGAASSSQRIQTLRHHILKRETRRDFNGKLI